MKRYKISVFTDAIFVGFCVFFTFFIIFTSFVGRNVSLVCAAVLGVAVFVCAAYLLGKRFDKKTLVLSEEPAKKNLIFNLCLYSTNKTFIDLYGFFGKKLVKTPKGLYFEDEDAYVLPCFSFDGLRKSRIADAYKKTGGKKLYVLTDCADNETLCFCKMLKCEVEFICADQIYALFKKANMLPDSPVSLESSKPRFKTVINRVFVKKRAAKYFVFGLTFLGFSFLTPYKAYYVIFGSVMMTFSLICVLKTPPKSEKRFWEV